MADEPTIESVQAELAASRARIKELNDESKGHRLNAQNARGEAEAARAEAERIAKENGEKLTAAEARAAEAVAQAQARVVNADLRLAAKDAGANDTADVLALMPREAVKLNDAGEITNAAELIDGLKKAKPYLFGAASTSSTAVPPPAPGASTKPKNAMDMDADEYAAARAAAVRRR